VFATTKLAAEVESMQTVEVSCPNCGANQGTPAPHDSRICSFCGTHYLLAPHVQAVPDQTPQQEEEDRRWLNLKMTAIALVALVILVIGMIWLLTRERAPERVPFNEWPGFYNAPRR
jgi:hypothetical protein